MGKPWLFKVNFGGPLLAAALHTFQGAKIFTRVLAPMLEKYIEDAIFRWSEEERVQKAMRDAVEGCGVKESFQKKTLGHLQKAYDEVYFNAPYGTSEGETPEMSMLQ